MNKILLKIYREIENPSFLSEDTQPIKNSNFKIELTDDPVFVEYKKPFTATPYYNYLDNFLIGLKIETSISYSGDCIDSIVYTMDDYVYFLNNITDFSKKSWEAPIMNFSRAIGGNFSYIPYNCYLFGDNFWAATVAKYDSFSGNIANFFLAFLFNIMGNSLKFKVALNDIASD